jgi:sugar-specific transcriptional regulator TrmB
MNQDTLTKLGLTPSQSKAYIVLVQEGSITPPDLAKKIKETRTNTYKILDRLADMGLAVRETDSAKASYRVVNPVVLEELSKKRRNEVLQQEQMVKDAMPNLLNYFYTYSEQPGVRFFQGQQGIHEIFDDMLRTRKDIYLVRSPADINFYDKKFFDNFRAKRAKLGIKTYALTPDLKGLEWSKELDKAHNFIRTWVDEDQYSSSVEWDVYGDKLAIISYGQEAIGMIIESPQIASAFKQLFKLVQLSKANFTE